MLPGGQERYANDIEYVRRLFSQGTVGGTVGGGALLEITGTNIPVPPIPQTPLVPPIPQPVTNQLPAFVAPHLTGILQGTNIPQPEVVTTIPTQPRYTKQQWKKKKAAEEAQRIAIQGITLPLQQQLPFAPQQYPQTPTMEYLDDSEEENEDESEEAQYTSGEEGYEGEEYSEEEEYLPQNIPGVLVPAPPTIVQALQPIGTLPAPLAPTPVFTTVPPITQSLRVTLPPITQSPRVTLPPVAQSPRVTLPPVAQSPRVTLPPVAQSPRVTLPTIPLVPQLPAVGQVQLPPVGQVQLPQTVRTPNIPQLPAVGQVQLPQIPTIPLGTGSMVPILPTVNMPRY